MKIDVKQYGPFNGNEWDRITIVAQFHPLSLLNGSQQTLDTFFALGGVQMINDISRTAEAVQLSISDIEQARNSLNASLARLRLLLQKSAKPDQFGQVDDLIEHILRGDITSEKTKIET